LRHCFIIFVLCFFQCEQPHYAGKVVGISDGDTFTMLNKNHTQLRIRLYGIDAPEKRQPFGKDAKKFLSDLIFEKNVSVQEIETDRYGRTIAIVKLGDRIINEEILKAGLAWHYTQYDDNPLWDALEASAQVKRKGLWAQDHPTAPWHFRKQNRIRQKK
jgi:micrococcal nuclease